VGCGWGVDAGAVGTGPVGAGGWEAETVAVHPDSSATVAATTMRRG
jgi:hypothetical protein